MGVLADAIEITGLPRDNFEIHEISKEEFEVSRKLLKRIEEGARRLASLVTS